MKLPSFAAGTDAHVRFRTEAFVKAFACTQEVYATTRRKATAILVFSYEISGSA